MSNIPPIPLRQDPIDPRTNKLSEQWARWFEAVKTRAQANAVEQSGNIDVPGNATIDGNAAVGGNLVVGGTMQGGAVVGSSLAISGAATVTGALAANGGLTATGPVKFRGVDGTGLSDAYKMWAGFQSVFNGARNGPAVVLGGDMDQPESENVKGWAIVANTLPGTTYGLQF